MENIGNQTWPKCPGQKQAILWHEFCMVRYSDEAIFGNVAYSPFDWGNNIENVPDQDKFYQELNILLDSLRNQTAYNRSPKKFAAASRPYPDYRTIYAFEQCTADITPQDCGSCLNQSALEIRQCCDGSRGVRILRPSCYLRFETDPFYNESMVETVLQPPISTAPGKDDNKKSQFPTPIYIQSKCQNNGSYTSNSTYKKNLDTILSSISPNIDTNGFYNASIGEKSDRVNVIAMCRADLQPSQCHRYVRDASIEILNKCPGQKQAILWHEFCMVRYSDEAIFGNVAYSPFDWGNNSENVPDQDKFYQELNILLDSLRNQTAYNRSPKKFAAASRPYPDYRTIYAFEQCTADITPQDCGSCLNQSALEIRQCCDGSRGVKILRPSCYLRFETDPFYNESMVETVLQPPISTAPGKDDNTTRNDDKTTRTIVIVIVLIVICLILALCIGIFVKIKKTRKSKTEENIERDIEISTIESMQYNFSTIRDATDDFSDANKLGQGGFGFVYKGTLSNGNEVAVKRLSRNSGQGDTEFKNEVLLVAKLQHRNLVRLLGFSVEGSERLLVYEFVCNGSLDRFIFDPIKRAHLDWEKRYKIIGGVARGLLYLHQDSRLQIIHRDLKASNVLLDGEMNSKISDFGLARLFDPDKTQRSTNRVVGTYGYMAPEYAMRGQISFKSDVFSFGVLVLEIISGQKTNNFGNGENLEDLLSCVWKNWNQGTPANIIDSALKVSSSPLRDIVRCIHIGLLCVQEMAADRPTMASVILMLTSSTITLPIPSQPPFFNTTTFDSKIPYVYESNSRTSDTTKSSKHKSDNSEGSLNSASMSELYPR
ncbi:Cysteine-rich receptor-like protein kinase 26 [Abeliophyllum distichum]|uniref:Cysteine-rich receptor-like protein kinase 26 n=1 Tax=Abeliophyllum distichum TaxID=126358 RepID=A0ABD1PTD2_9LAMI